jgi:hypothetical protein
VSDTQKLVVVYKTKCLVRNGTRWHVINIPWLEGSRPEGAICKALIHGDTLYLAESGGEWGGGLEKLDLISGKIECVHRSSFDNVADMSMDRNGTLWFVCEMEHMGGMHGSLVSYDSSGLQCHAGVAGFAMMMDYQLPSGPFDTLNWNLGLTAFHGLSLQEDGSFLVAASDYGIVKFADGEWKQLTPHWRWWPIYNMEVIGSTAFIASGPEGVVVCNLQTGKVTHVEISTSKKPPHWWEHSH